MTEPKPPPKRAIEWSVEWVTETGSTNADLAARGADAPEGSVLVADYQSAGRGRLDRAWVAPAGSGLLVSVLLRPRLDPARLHLVVVAVALAAADATETLTGVRPDLKWPNDLLAPADDGQRRKLGGILAEITPPTGSSTDEAPVLVVGLGLNLTRPPDQPPELAELAAATAYLDELATNELPASGSGSSATGSSGSGLSAGDVSAAADSTSRMGPPDRAAVLELLLERLGYWYGLAATTAGREQLLRQWEADLITIGLRVRAERRDGDIEGQAIGVTDAGALVISTAGGESIEVHAGDVIHLR